MGVGKRKNKRKTRICCANVFSYSLQSDGIGISAFTRTAVFKKSDHLSTVPAPDRQDFESCSMSASVNTSSHRL